MADNTILNVGSGGDTIADEDVAGIKYQRVKIVDGTVAGTTPMKIDANGALVAKPATGTNTGGQTSVASTITADTTLIAANTARVGLMIYNESTQTLFLLLGAGVESATVYSLQIPPNTLYEAPAAFVTLRASGHWVVANGSARITAVT